MLTIEARSLARRQPLIPEWQAPVPQVEVGGAVTLRALLSHLVTSEVEAFRKRQEQRGLLQVLSREEVAAGVERGKVATGSQDLHQEVDTDAAIATAVQAFEDGIYLVVLDGEEQRELDSPLKLGPDSRVTFLRLSLLAGG